MKSNFRSKIISSFLLLVLLIGCLSTTSCLIPFEKLEYIVNSDGKTCTITGLGTYSSADLVIPSHIGKYEVAAIADYAFQGTDVETFSGPDTLTTIGKYAFYNCQRLQIAEIPTNVIEIGEHCFEYCENLRNITLSSQLTKIGDSTFACCSNIDIIDLPDGIVTIGENAFLGCKRITSVNLPNTLKTIGVLAFSGCASLKSITLPDSLTTIEKMAFFQCISLEKIYIPASVVRIGGGPFSYNNSTQIQVDENNLIISSINGDLYYNHNQLFLQYACAKTDIYFEIPEGVVEIGGLSFGGAINLTEIAIPNTIKVIGSYVFLGANNITALYYNGTVADWNNIEKAYNWIEKTESVFSIICTDGTIDMDGTVTYN